MKRFWIGICVLAILLAAGLGNTYLMMQAHDPISRQLAQAAEAATAGNWDQATALFLDAQSQWDSWIDLAAAFTDHNMLETADGLFAELRVYEKTDEPQVCAAGCAQLSRLIRAIAESHLPSWQNLF